MAEGEDDYLSDKFLIESAPSGSKSQGSSYSERRRQAQRKSELKNVQNRKKSRRQLEEEAREEGLKKSLFERAKEEEQELGTQSKAMSLMMKMGFKPGQTLGASDSMAESHLGRSSERIAVSPTVAESTNEMTDGSDLKDSNKLQHRKEPLPIELRSGKLGLGLGKRALSPDGAERLAKTAKLDEEVNKETYRSRAREEYEERRAEGRLLSATRTLLELDEKSGVQFNVLSLDPHDAESFPYELLEKLTDYAMSHNNSNGVGSETEHERLRRQMRLDALQPLDTGVNDNSLVVGGAVRNQTSKEAHLSEELVEEAADFLRLSARSRLKRLLAYLRQKYAYCFWCGTRYNDRGDLDANCPGEEEDMH